MEAGQTCTGTGALVAQARGCQATAKRIWLLSLLPGVEEPQDSIFTRCHLRRRFCSGRQVGTVSFMEHREPRARG